MFFSDFPLVITYILFGCCCSIAPMLLAFALDNDSPYSSKYKKHDDDKVLCNEEEEEEYTPLIVKLEERGETKEKTEASVDVQVVVEGNWDEEWEDVSKVPLL